MVSVWMHIFLYFILTAKLMIIAFHVFLNLFSNVDGANPPEDQMEIDHMIDEIPAEAEIEIEQQKSMSLLRNCSLKWHALILNFPINSIISFVDAQIDDMIYQAENDPDFNVHENNNDNVAGGEEGKSLHKFNLWRNLSS